MLTITMLHISHPHFVSFPIPIFFFFTTHVMMSLQLARRRFLSLRCQRLHMGAGRRSRKRHLKCKFKRSHFPLTIGQNCIGVAIAWLKHQVINPWRACTAKDTVLGLVSSCVCLFPRFLPLGATRLPKIYGGVTFKTGEFCKSTAYGVTK